jgi:hypothetical protein
VNDFIDRPAGIDLPDADARSAAASLPRWFRSSSEPTAGRWVPGEGEWVAAVRAAVVAGAPAIVLVEPGWADPDAVRELTALPVPVVVDSAIASNAVIAAAAPAWTDMIQPTGVLEVTTTHDLDSVAVLLDQLAAVRALAGRIVDVRVAWTADSHSAVATVSVGGGELTATLLGASSAVANGTTIRWLGPQGALELELPPAVNAAPGRFRVVTVDGEMLAPTISETAHRATLSRLHELLDRGTSADDLEVLAEHLKLLAGQRVGDRAG